MRPAAIFVACKYMHLSADDVAAIGTGDDLPLVVSENVDDELRELAQARDG